MDIEYICGNYDRGKIVVANMDIIYWSVHSLFKMGRGCGKEGGRGLSLFWLAASFTLSENMKIHVIIYPLPEISLSQRAQVFIDSRYLINTFIHARSCTGLL